MQSLAFFNNKGGVGKTTLACNMASYFAREHDLNVLVVDCDPQCNASQLLLAEEMWEDLYANRRDSSNKTLLKALRHIRAGDSQVDTDLPLYKSERFGCDVLAGHPGLSILEDRFSSSWGELLQGTPGGARRTLWAGTLASSVRYDLVIFDLGPSLGALNRSVLLGSEFFMTPMSADLFSLYALDNIGTWIKSWVRDYERSAKTIREEHDDDFVEGGLPETLPVASGYLGYTVQQYVTKNTGGQLRAVNAYDRYRRQIPERAQVLAEYQAPSVVDLNIGLVPNMFSMVPLAQAQHAPISDLTPADGVRGAQVSQHKRYVARLREIGQRLAENLGIGG
ncbi:ParA family protein [Pseudosporangium ferrugineum]|uniref:AAA domain-containing protein n=1 Tax=Pseudosporangium ferrugineum TaxID=439699 RepID=A0A2T0R4S9_9ACTN|nr:ParA family protein [Pseudosporangium ferrugineum]PRY15378.1 AAA domain-containing protein [Pseudosporangium ferrugineum]